MTRGQQADVVPERYVAEALFEVIPSLRASVFSYPTLILPAIPYELVCKPSGGGCRGASL